MFKLDDQFDFLITAQHVYILHPAGFERIAEIEEFAAQEARVKTLALGATVKFLDFGGLADFVAKHRRGARLIAALNGRNDLQAIKRPIVC